LHHHYCIIFVSHCIIVPLHHSVASHCFIAKSPRVLVSTVYHCRLCSGSNVCMSRCQRDALYARGSVVGSGNSSGRGCGGGALRPLLHASFYFGFCLTHRVVHITQGYTIFCSCIILTRMQSKLPYCHAWHCTY
jgi:hypothetical protein